MVEPFGFGKGNGIHFGGLNGFDPLAVTNKKGEFRLGVPDEGITTYVQATAPFKAPRKSNSSRPALVAPPPDAVDGRHHPGRLVKDGKPLAGLAVGAAQKNRDAETFVGDFQAATDGKGSSKFATYRRTTC